jgi:hypothetical protein
MPDPDKNQPQPWWLSLAQALAATALPIVIALVGHLYTRALKEREVQARFVELALAILQQRPDSANRNLRGWAIKVVDHYSGVTLTDSAAADLQQTLRLPVIAVAPGNPQEGYSGIRSADSLQAHIDTHFPADIVWWHHQSPGITHVVGRLVGPGPDSFPLDKGGTIHVRIVNHVTHDTVAHDQSVDCTKGTCIIPVP